jgi:hypothetical protein
MLPYGEVGQRKSIPQGPAGSLKSGAFFGGLADTFLSVGGHAIGHLHINEIPHFKYLKTIFHTFVA